MSEELIVESIIDSIDWSEASFEEIKKDIISVNIPKEKWLSYRYPLNKFQKSIIEKIFG